MAVACAPAPDRLTDELASGTPEPLRSQLLSDFGEERLLLRALDLVRYASDASPYRLIPQAIVMAHDAGDVAKVFALGRRLNVPVTLRSGGTSLNGQGQGAGILVDVRRHFAGIRVEAGGERVRVGPGTVLGRVNRALHKHDRRVGPDPASTDLATVGGVIANNAGGMRCGVRHDSYSTLRSLEFVTAAGTRIDTAAPDAAERFAAEEPELAAGLAEIRDDIRADSELSGRIRSKFEIKNTTGYRLCAFLDADEPVEIFRRLLVGSEGTLGFVSEAVFETVPHGRHVRTGLLFFSSIDAASAPVPALVEAGATAVELMVNPTLIAASYSLPGIPEEWREIPPDGAVLLVELRTDDPAELDGMEQRALAAVEGHELLETAAFTGVPEEIEVFWLVREGMQGIVGAMRPQGTSLIIEDVCVRPERIAECARDVQALLGKYEFLTGVAGHASAGNLHFLLTPALGEPADRDRYEGFMGELVDLIVDKYDGSLKAEHGTGRNMAPYVKREWGERATELMWRIKRLADPDGVLNPGAVLSDDPEIHLSDLKSTPAIEDVSNANACIECGFCEPVCPSRDLTTTPRQRIVLRREMARQPEGSPVLAALERDYEYDGLDTCAADGSCKLVCPVGIDTGELVKSLRAEGHSERSEGRALKAAERWGTVERVGRVGLRAGGMAARVGLGRVIPRWIDPMPPAAPGRLPETEREGAAAVYLPACINRIFGASPEHRWVVDALVRVSARAGKPLWIPDDVPGVCCGTPWTSKGYTRGAEHMKSNLAEAVERWTGGGELPLVVDATSCTHGIGEGEIQVIDAVAWAHDHLLPSLEVRRPISSVAVHPTCSARHLGLVATMESLARAVAEHVTVPLVATCCGMAGDRGLEHPELIEAATAAEAKEVSEGAFDACVSANRTCEIALEHTTGQPYTSLIQVLEASTRP